MNGNVKEKIGFIIPCYRSENTIKMVIEEIKNTMQDMNRLYEIILINDCSPDETFTVLKHLVKSYNNITAINLSKNFGQHAAIMAGFSYLSEDIDIVCCLDDDGQTPAS